MKNNYLKPITLFFILLICAVSLARVSMPQNSPLPSQTRHHTTVRKTPADYRPYRDPPDLRRPFDWHKASEMKAYPRLTNDKNDVTVRVSLRGNRVYLLRHNQPIYTMLSSAGLFKKGKSLTPTGTFKINDERGDSFYNPQLNEGAQNWTSWDPNNVYLFHSVPTKANGKYNKREAQKLGLAAGSHGCIRLSVADSYWLMNHLVPGTKVIIKNN